MSKLTLFYKDKCININGFQSAIPGDLNHVGDREKARRDWEKRNRTQQ